MTSQTLPTDHPALVRHIWHPAYLPLDLSPLAPAASVLRLRRGLETFPDIGRTDRVPAEHAPLPPDPPRPLES
jgi:hypothetical protein